ncbi:hypothetical protein J0B03_10075 [Alkalibacter rhizosphaerae]|uniref:Uroporphyrinogen decarboxylase (URO-D) domain-containing protein n=1 Tax=Alkalibacter rhizosphaerae TaxID=2815577 RepID=A0A974XED0_9FIRM|nr:uroporphyrinogen decarboxylase family protein [Alkalibacter rhizosphaerae]QSX08136.1 hypothetical protein J0B03_10075 [Alkalibacter rhizosphaerae]
MATETQALILNTIRHMDVPKVAKGELVLDDTVIASHYHVPEVKFEHRWDFAKEMEMDLVTHFPTYNKEEALPLLNMDPLELKKWTINTDFFHFYVLDGAFETGLAHYGFGEFCSMVMTDDEELEDFVLHMERMNMENIRKLADLGSNGIIFADDVAFQGGLIVRPEMFKDHFMASIERQVELMDKLGLVPFFHSDGNYLAILDDIVNAGFTGLHCIDKKCDVTLEDLKPYGKDLCLWGIWTYTTWNWPRRNPALNRS